MKLLNLDTRSQKVLDFESALRSRIVGQDKAVSLFTDIMEAFYAGMNPIGRPVANVMLLGPTGTGKTRTVEAVAEILFGDPKAVVKIDCAEFQHSHEVAKLIGSPPGYLGHRETTPMLTQERLNRYHRESLELSIVLFDEIEKASDSVWQLMLGILDKATLSLGDGRNVDFSKTIVVMTSNIGASEIEKLATHQFGFGQASTGNKHAKLEDVAIAAARRKFSPEFINRIDRMITFRHLEEKDIRNIIELELDKVQTRLSSVGKYFIFKLTKPMEDLLLSEGYDKRYGARSLKRVIEQRIVNTLSKIIATNQVKSLDTVFIGLDANGNVVAMKESAPRKVSATATQPVGA